MFALLKFQQRNNAAAFSHAFVLTIKICSLSEEESLFNLKYPIVREVDATGVALKNTNDTTHIDERATKTMVHTTDKVSTKKLRVYPGKRINQILKHSKNAVSETSVSSILQNDLEKSANFLKKSNGGTKNETTCTVTENFNDKQNTKVHNISMNKSTNCGDKKSGKDTDHIIAHRQDQSRKDEAQEVDKTDGANEECTKIQKQHQETAKIRKHQIFSSSKSSPAKIIKDDCNVTEQLLLGKSSSDKDSTCQEQVDDKTNLAENDDIIEITIDSSKTPNQYFVKKNLDNTRQDRANAKSAMSPPVIDKSAMKENSQQGTSEVKNTKEDLVSDIENEKINEEFIATGVVDDHTQNSTYRKSYRARKQKSRESSEKKIVADDKVLRSSNITNLVMEGLMFTIRQDQDSVAVIEQKTKLEVDEVLENSEKVETEAGEKCLMNSSLLRLENLITMIDPPRDKDEQHKANHNVISNKAYSSPLNVSSQLDDTNYVDGTVNKLSIPSYERRNLMDRSSPCRSGWQQICSTANNDSCSANRNVMEKMDQSMNWEDNHEQDDEECMHENDIEIIDEQEKEDDEEIEEEEEDIVPEIFHSTTFSPEKTNPSDTELLMDDMDIEDIDKLDTSMKNHNNLPLASCYSSSSNKVPTSKTCKNSTSSKRETNIPKVISNKAITVEQIPLALQKILRHKRKFSQIKVASEISVVQDNKRKVTQNTTSTENAVPETSALSDQSNLREFCWQQQRAHSDIANSDSHSTDRNPVEDSEQLMEWEDDDHERDDQCTENPSSGRNRDDADPDTANKSNVDITYDTEKNTRIDNRNKSSVTDRVDLEDVAKSSNSDAGHTKEKNYETHHTSQTSPSIETRKRHDSPRKLQDITEDFYYDLYAHNKNNATQQRCLRQRRRSLNNPEDIKNGKMRIEMLKFIQDMTEGVRVVVRRLNLDSRSSLS